MSQEPAPSAIEYVHSTNFPELLRSLNISLAVTTYQAQRLLAFSPQETGKLFMLMRVFERPTGLAIGENQMAMCANNAIWLFVPAGELRDLEGNLQPYDLCLTPHKAYITGDISAHEMAFIHGQLHIVNTRFSCLCTLDEKYSFRPIWRPPFVTDLMPEDRCHLNGMAIDSSGIRYLTALGESNSKDGWRPNKASGGILMRYPDGQIIARNLSMPHSPRLRNGQLFLLDSGRGELVTINPANGEKQTIAKFPGFLRGLAFHGDYAFVGVCKIREKRTFGNLPIESMYDKFECAIHAVNLRDGSHSFIQFTRGIEELFDIQILAGVQKPHVIGMEELTVDGVFVLPPAESN
ncbi:MAG TPA: TIGR03032 family protein [Tepidisphaeraceae bacterium]|jgi:uncharacterized protein (TIGR03032 family)